MTGVWCPAEVVQEVFTASCGSGAGKQREQSAPAGEAAVGAGAEQQGQPTAWYLEHPAAGVVRTDVDSQLGGVTRDARGRLEP